MNKSLNILQSLWSKIAVVIGALASVTAILAFDFSPPLPPTSAAYVQMIDQRALSDGTFTAFVAETNPAFLPKAENNTATPDDLNRLNVPDRLRSSLIAVNNLGMTEIEDLTVQFSFYKDEALLVSDYFAGELTVGPQREISSQFSEPAALEANFVEICMVYDGTLPLERVTERYLIPIGSRLLEIYGSKIEYDRKRRIAFPARCQSAPQQTTIDNWTKYGI